MDMDSHPPAIEAIKVPYNKTLTLNALEVRRVPERELIRRVFYGT